MNCSAVALDQKGHSRMISLVGHGSTHQHTAACNKYITHRPVSGRPFFSEQETKFQCCMLLLYMVLQQSFGGISVTPSWQSKVQPIGSCGPVVREAGLVMRLQKGSSIPSTSRKKCGWSKWSYNPPTSFTAEVTLSKARSPQLHPGCCFPMLHCICVCMLG